MTRPFYAVLIRHWQQWPEQRRTPVLAALLALAVLVFWQSAWQPGRERLLAAELRYGREVALAEEIFRAAPSAAPVHGEALVLTPAELSDSAQAAGLELTGLDFRQEQLNLSVQGQPTALLQWLHQVEFRGGRFSSLSLQPDGPSLQARVTLHAPGESSVR
ncbi:type II secretion system protein GspM [Pseudomonas akapageensis]|uniref:type II secretion system protein GspM n=1 Tax=Pseudomonas akapageensis TaxID=2609961 RepID=UPI0014072F59|nr:type II secretion system protein GspM [Pseudomonas akapageensis]